VGPPFPRRYDEPTTKEAFGMRAESRTLFFMHIGKTAGSYLNQCFSNAFGKDSVTPFCQDLIDASNNPAYRQLFEDKSVISGHFYLADWTEFAQRQGIDAALATVLRSPLHQIVSSLRFLDGYNDPSRHQEVDMMHLDLRDIVLRLAEVDFADAGSLDGFLTTLTPVGVRLFDNNQSRFFLGRERGDAGPSADLSVPLTLACAPRLAEALDRFDLVGLTERLPETLVFLSELTGHTILPVATRINETQSPRTIDVSDPWIRRVLAKRIVVDDWLYRQAAERFDLALNAAGTNPPQTEASG
jgi:hypothetical protein